MQLKYLVDFDPQLTEIVSETKYMEQLGFSVPELARNVALQVSQTGLHWKTRASILHILYICGLGYGLANAHVS